MDAIALQSTLSYKVSMTTRRWAIGLPVLRVALVAAASVSVWLIARIDEVDLAFPPPPMLAVVAMLPVNVVCLLLVARLLRGEGRTVRELLGYEPRRLGRDLLWGLLWVVVMYLPFVATIMLVVWLQYGSEIFARMETIFFDPASIPALDPVTWSVIAVVGVLTFAPLNAPVEELVYRGYAQGELDRRWPTILAILVPAALFATQHIWYAPTPAAVLAFVCAFFVWGAGSGLIYRRQRRLMPLVLAHGLVNLFFTLPVLVFVMTGLPVNGVV